MLLCMTSSTTIEYLMLWVSQRISTVQLSNYQLSDLEYVDDTILFCEAITYLESAYNIYHKKVAKLGLRVNWSKNKLMHIGNDLNSPPSQSGWGRGRICQMFPLFMVNHHQ